MIRMLALSTSLAALACIGVAIWLILVRVSASHLRNATVSREWLQRQSRGGRE